MMLNEELVFDLTAYIIIKRRKGEVIGNPIDEFNTWSSKNHLRIDNYQVALWCADYIQDLAEMPMRELELAYEIDEKRMHCKKNGLA